MSLMEAVLEERPETSASDLAVMLEGEAQACADAIRTNLVSARRLLLELYEREGWKALGYGSWKECAAEEFNYSVSYLYRMMTAARIERNLAEDSPIGESIPESQLRPLAGMEPEEQRQVWQQASEDAGGTPTAADVENAARTHRLFQEARAAGDRSEWGQDEPFAVRVGEGLLVLVQYEAGWGGTSDRMEMRGPVNENGYHRHYVQGTISPLDESSREWLCLGYRRADYPTPRLFAAQLASDMHGDYIRKLKQQENAQRQKRLEAQAPQPDPVSSEGEIPEKAESLEDVADRAALAGLVDRGAALANALLERWPADLLIDFHARIQDLIAERYTAFWEAQKAADVSEVAPAPEPAPEGPAEGEADSLTVEPEMPEEQWIVGPELFAKIEKAYSGETISAKGRTIRKPLEINGKLYVNVGAGVFGEKASAACFEVIPEAGYPYRVFDYYEKWDYARDHGDQYRGYHGIRVFWKGKPHVLRGPRIVFILQAEADGLDSAPSVDTSPPPESAFHVGQRVEVRAGFLDPIGSPPAWHAATVTDLTKTLIYARIDGLDADSTHKPADVRALDETAPDSAPNIRENIPLSAEDVTCPLCGAADYGRCDCDADAVNAALTGQGD